MTDSAARSISTARYLPLIAVATIVLVIAAITIFWNNRTASRKSEGNTEATQSVDASVLRPDTVPLRKRRVPVEDPSGIASRRTEQRKKVQEMVNSAQSALNTQFQREKIDARWAPSKERALTELGTSDQIKQLNAEIRNLSVDCRTKVCRITGDFPTMTAGDDWFTLYMNNIAAEVPYASYKYVPNGDGSVRIEVYGVGRK